MNRGGNQMSQGMRSELLFTVGPVEMEDSILWEGARQPPYFRTPEFSKLNLEISELIKSLLNTRSDSEVILLTASGTGAMEATVLNLFGTDDKVLVVDGGTFGHRFVEICETLLVPHTVLSLEPGRDLPEGLLEDFRGKGYTGLLINAHETSTGLLYSLESLGKFCKEENLLLVVDAISSFLADDYFMDFWGISATILSSQKALALAPGLSVVILDKRAAEKMKSNSVRSLYFDFKSYIDNMRRGQTPFTPAVSIILQMHKRLREIDEIGVDTVRNSIKSLASHFRNNLDDLPLKIFPERSSSALTALSPIDGSSAFEIYKRLRKEFSITVTPNGGSLKDKVFRVGHIGNLSIEDNERLISSLKKLF